MSADITRTDIHTSSAASTFRRDIQGLRGIAVLLVVAFHAGWSTPGGFVGVDVFFVLSGFLIGGLLLAELDREGRVDLRSFFSRRIRRLLPALALLTSVTLVASLFVIGIGPQLDTTGRTGIAASLFGANVYLAQESGYFAPAAELNPLLHTWSLSVEEQFYLVFPLIFVVAALIAARRRTRIPAGVVVAIVTIAVTVVSLALSWSLTETVTELGDAGEAGVSRLAFYAPFTRAWEFAAGALLAFLVARGKISTRYPGVTALAGLGLIAVAAFTFDGGTPFPGLAAVLPVGGTLLLLLAGGSPAPASRMLSIGPLVRIGDLSYGWYLWHWPAIVFATWIWPDDATMVTLAAIGSLIPAVLSYVLLEQPIRRNHAIVGRRAAALAVACITIPVVLGVAVVMINDRAVGMVDAQADTIDNAAENPDATAGDQSPGNGLGGSGSCPDDPSACEAEPRGDGLVDVVLVGDSHAAALSSGLEAAVERHGMRYELLFEHGCSFMLGTTANPDCVEWQNEVFETLVEWQPRVVVINGYTTGRVTGINSGEESNLYIYSRTGERAEEPEEGLAYYADGIDEAVARLTYNDIAVLIVSTVPDFDDPPLHEQSAIETLSGSDFESEEVPLPEARDRNADILAIEQAIAERYPSVRVIDPIPILCTSSECAQATEGKLLYRDTDHLADFGALMLAEGILPDILELHAELAWRD